MLASGRKSVEVCGETLWLLPEKAIFWPEKKALLVADIHLGKASHFRKNGIAVPRVNKNLQVLEALLDAYHPEKVIFLGDLFHSVYNQKWETFGEFISRRTESFHLILGNHDILKSDQYEKAGLNVHPDHLVISPFYLCHIPLENHVSGPSEYVLAGHIHPGIRMLGPGRQSLRLPCFFFGPRQAILPAFGEFTGTHVLYPDDEDRIFVVADGEVIALSGGGV